MSASRTRLSSTNVRAQGLAMIDVSDALIATRTKLTVALDMAGRQLEATRLGGVRPKRARSHEAITAGG